MIRSDLKESSDIWHESLNASTDRLAADKLYLGEYWSVVRNIAKQERAKIWIFSAGMGIIPYSAKIPSYSATYSSDSLDSVRKLESKNKDTNQNWFNLILEKQQFGIGTAELKTILNQDTILFAVSRSYLQTIQNILLEINNPQLFILGSNLRNIQVKNKVEVPGSLRMALGGSLQTVNIRLVEYLLTQTTLLQKETVSLAEINSVVKTLSENSGDLPKYERLKSTDVEIESFIRSRPIETHNDSHSRALRDFRNAGNACEQSRFKKIFLSVMEKH